MKDIDERCARTFPRPARLSEDPLQVPPALAFPPCSSTLACAAAMRPCLPPYPEPIRSWKEGQAEPEVMTALGKGCSVF